MAKLTADQDGDGALLKDLLDPQFTASGDGDQGDADDADKQALQERNRDELEGVVYSVRHTDIVLDSKVERQISEKVVPAFERHEAESSVRRFLPPVTAAAGAPPAPIPTGRHQAASGMLQVSAIPRRNRGEISPAAHKLAPRQVVDNVLLLAASLGKTPRLPPNPTFQDIQNVLAEISADCSQHDPTT